MSNSYNTSRDYDFYKHVVKFLFRSD